MIHAGIIIPKLHAVEGCMYVRQESDGEWILMGQATLSCGM
jgi:hypothetical protein